MTAVAEPAVAEPRTAELPAPFGPGFAAAVHQRLAALREQCPVVQVRAGGGDLWLVLDHDDVTRCLTDPRLSVQRTGRPVRRPGQRATQVGLMNLEPPDHTRIRRLSNAALTDRRLQRYRPAIEAALHRLLDELAQSSPPIDVISQLGLPFTFAVLAEVFDLGPECQPALRTWMIQVFQRSPAAVADTEANLERIEAVIVAELRRRRHEPGDDVLSAIQRAWLADGGLDEAELVSLVVMLLLAGFDSTAQMLGICAIALSQQAELGRRLRADPAQGPAVVEELLRWDTSGPFSTPRWAREDIELGATVIPRGSQVVLSFLAANHDPRHYPDAAVIDVDRAAGPRQLAFGHGPHFCPGSALARIELVAAVTILAQRFPLLQLAIPVAELPWRGTYQQRTLRCLPMRLGPAADS